jgi:hypothetical protein
MVPQPHARQGLVNGLLCGSVLAAFAVTFGILGLTPSLTWIPELPLLAIGAAVPVLILGYAGRQAVLHSGDRRTGFFAGAVAGAMGGLAGGVCYLAYGKPALNLVVGSVVGFIGGASIGGLAGLGTRRAKPS